MRQCQVNHAKVPLVKYNEVFIKNRLIKYNVK